LLRRFLAGTPTLGARGIASGGDEGVSRVDFSSDGGMSWRETERGKDEGNIQLPTMANARMEYKAPIKPKNVDASEARTRRELVELLSL
jgi:hypothetical protein